MNKAILMLFLVILTLSCSTLASANDPLALENILNSYAEYMLTMDVPSLTSLADERIVLTGNSIFPLHLTGQTYTDYLTKQFSQAKVMEYELSDLTITFNEDGTAVVTAIEYFSTQREGQEKATSNREITFSFTSEFKLSRINYGRKF